MVTDSTDLEQRNDSLEESDGLLQWVNKEDGGIARKYEACLSAGGAAAWKTLSLQSAIGPSQNGDL